MNKDWKHIEQAYFIGIGGIGMSALARYFHHQGVKVSGYDRMATQLTRELEAAGMDIHYEDRPDLLPQKMDLVVYTPAVPDHLGELQEVRRRGWPLYKRAEVLGLISRTQRTLAIAGTHGKTTTCCILSHLLQSGGVDASAFLGGIALNYNSNFIAGNSNWVVVEADEYDRSFLQLQPTHAAILATDADHLDIYETHDQMMTTGFRAFARQVSEQGELWVREDLAGQFPDREVYTFGYGRGDTQIDNLRVIEGGRVQFDYKGPRAELTALEWSMPGRHNAFNAAVAITLALTVGATEQGIRRGLSSFLGIRRRYERVMDTPELVVINDYAHHPEELRATIAATRSLFPGKRISGVFQPHLYSRTRDFAAGFAAALDGLDEILLLPIYPAREAPIDGVSAEMILKQMQSEHKELISDDKLITAVKKLSPEVLLVLGAGDIDALLPALTSALIHTPKSID